MKETRVSFQGCYLEGAHIERANLENVDFSATNLTRVFLYNCNLQGASFESSGLEKGDLTKSDLHRVNLNRTNMKGIILNGAKGIYQFGPIGDSGRICYAVDWGDKIMFQIGCFWGTEEEAVEKVSEKYGENSSYVRQILLAAEILKEKH